MRRARVDRALSHARHLRWLVLAPLVLGVYTAPSRAAAPGSPSTDCVERYEQALARRNQGKLTAAHTGFAACTEPTCPGPVREECMGQVRELETLIPTVIPSALSGDGHELAEVRVELDGRVLTEKLD